MKKLGLAAVHTILLSPLILLGIASFARWSWPTVYGDAFFTPWGFVKGITQGLLFAYYDYCLVWPASAIVTLTTLASLSIAALQLRNHLKAKA